MRITRCLALRRSPEKRLKVYLQSKCLYYQHIQQVLYTYTVSKCVNSANSSACVAVINQINYNFIQILLLVQTKISAQVQMFFKTQTQEPFKNLQSRLYMFNRFNPRRDEADQGRHVLIGALNLILNVLNLASRNPGPAQLKSRVRLCEQKPVELR